MGRKASWPPRLRRKPGTNQARTYWGGRWHACGLWDVARDVPTPAAVATHTRFLQEWAADPTAKVLRADDLLLAELWAAWRDSGHWDERRRRDAIWCQRALFGTPDAPGPHFETAVAEFGSAALSAWQAELCRAEVTVQGVTRRRYSRYMVQRYVWLVRECFRWGVESERVPAERHAALLLVRPPQAGKVREPRERVLVTAEDFAAAVAGKDRSEVSDFLRLLWWTGCRPSEAAGLTAGMVVRGGTVRTAKGGVVDLDAVGVWAAPLSAHKTARKGKERCLFFGPEAQKILGWRLDRGGVLFRTAGGGPLDPKTVNRLLAKRQKARKLTRWPLYSLRHACADRVTRHPKGGFEAAGAYLGHTPGGVTSRYTGVLWQRAAQVAADMG